MPNTVHNDAYRRLIDDLVATRINAGLTQQEVADRLGRPQSYVAKVEGYERRIDLVEFAELAREVRADAAALFKRLLKVI